MEAFVCFAVIVVYETQSTETQFLKHVCVCACVGVWVFVHVCVHVCPLAQGALGCFSKYK